MRYRIHQIKLNIDQGQEAFEGAIKKALKKRDLDIRDISIVKESIDARKKPDVRIVYTVDVTVEGNEAKILKQCGNKRASFAKAVYYKIP